MQRANNKNSEKNLIRIKFNPRLWIWPYVFHMYILNKFILNVLDEKNK